MHFFRLIFFFWCPVLALKLSLNQDLSRLQSQLSPEEIGQFLHSITNLSLLAEVIDPTRSRHSFDFQFYYNHYGCSEERIFNWSRIDSILINARLTHEDRLVLLNGDCLARWPELFSTSIFNLTRLLDAVPESNPLKYFSDAKVINWTGFFTTHWIDHWKIILNHAQSNPQFNFIPQVNKLFKRREVTPKYFSISHFSLIGPEAIDACFINSESPEDKEKCNEMSFGKSEIYSNFSSRDLFYWSLNISTALKYFPSKENWLIVRIHFKKFIEACRPTDIPIWIFLHNFSTLISTFISSFGVSNNDVAIVKLFRIFTVSGLNEEYGLDLIVLAVELYRWFESGIKFFKWNALAVQTGLNLIYKSLITHKASDPDFFLDFYLKTNIDSDNNVFLSSLRTDSFKMFLRNNYDPERPSHDLLNSLRTLSWSNESPKLTNHLKKFLSIRIRSSFLRKLSFNHPQKFEEIPSNIVIFFDENNSINLKLFECVYESLLNHSILIYPLKIELSGSGILGDIFKNSNDFNNNNNNTNNNILSLEVILNKFWSILALHDNNFIKIKEEIDDDGNYSNFNYLPNPWTHPNILFVAGCVMTLAFLHGIKLTSWSFKRSFFDSIFKLNLKPIDSNFKLFDEEDNFLIFYSLNDYIGSLNLDSDDIGSDSVSWSGVEELLKINENLKSKTTKKLFELQKEFTSKFRDGSYALNQELPDLWTGKQFLELESSSFSSDVSSTESSDQVETENERENELHATTPSPFEENENLDHEHELDESSDLEQEEEEARDLEHQQQEEEEGSTSQEIFDKSVEAAKLQLYSLYLGLQPLTRFLKSKEAYEAIFVCSQVTD